MTRYWFKRRRFGFGWSPASWEGWLVLGGFVLVVVAATVLIDVVDSEGARPALIFVGVIVVATAALLAITRAKGPKPHWRWGWAPGDDPDEDA